MTQPAYDLTAERMARREMECPMGYTIGDLVDEALREVRGLAGKAVA